MLNLRAMSSSCRNQDQSGFSMIEIMVAFFVLTVGIIAIASSFPYGLKINKESENTSALVYATQTKLEQYISMPYATIATGTVESRHSITADSASEYFHFERQTVSEYVDSNLIATSSDRGLKKITVTIYYLDGIGRNSRSYSNYVLIAKH